MRIAKRPLVIALSGLALLSMLAAAFAVVNAGRAHAASIGSFTRTITRGGAGTITAAPMGGDVVVQSHEFPTTLGGDDAADGGGTGAQPASGVDRSFSRAHGTSGKGQPARNLSNAKSNPELITSFDGLNFRQQRLANGGNQFSIEPPDQGMCASDGFVMETVNDVERVFDTSGNALVGVAALNTFYGYPAQFNRSTGQEGPFVTDPSCLYDAGTQRWYNVVLTLEVDPSSGAFLGPNHLDIAVSQTANPTGKWNIYRLPVQDDGTDGTPNHHCSLNSDGSGNGPCIGDYPHIGADANGFYITTNEYSLFGPEFRGAQVYAISKSALAAGAATLTVVQFDTHNADPTGRDGFTIWPAQTPGNQFAGANGGTEYFLSSNAADEVTVPDFSHPGPGQSNTILQWTLAGSSSLNSANPSVSLSSQSIGVNTYATPQPSKQKAGNTPLGQCLNDSTSKTFPVPAPHGNKVTYVSCMAFLFGAADPYAPEVEGSLDSNDTRMQQVTFANGYLWGALDTAVTINGHDYAGVAYYIVNPSSGNLVAQGTAGIDGNNLIYPAIGVTASGRGVMAFTLVGNDYYPSAAYAGLDALAGLGDVHVARAGAGPQDGFTEYRYFSPYGNGVPRPRWGDYGAAAVVGNSIWIASEYIGQTCDLATYEGLNGGAFGSCGGTRATLGNWDTRISLVTP